MTNNIYRIFTTVFAFLFVFGMHHFQDNFGGTGLELPFNLMAWCFISVLIGLGLWNIVLDSKVKYTKLTLALSLFCFSLFIPLIWSDSSLAYTSTGRFLGLLAGLAVFFSFQQLKTNQSQLNQLIIWVLVGVILEGCLGLTQKYLLIEGNWLNFDINSSPYGIFQQRNVASTFFVMGIAFSAYLLASNKTLNKIELSAIYAASFLSSWLIILNTSKTATIALAVLILTTAPLLIKKAKLKHLRLWYVVLTLGLTIPLIINTFSPDFIARAIQAPQRTIVYTISLFLISQNILLGTGYGSFSAQYPQAQAFYNQNIDPSLGYAAPNFGHPHNELLLWGIEGGILPILAFIIISIYVVKLLFQKGFIQGLFFIGTIFPAAFHSMTEYPFHHAAIIWFCFVFMLFCIDKTLSLNNTNQKTLPNTNLLKLVAILIPFTVIIFMVTAMTSLNNMAKFVNSGFKEPEMLNRIINTAPLTKKVELDIFYAPLIKSSHSTPENIEQFIEIVKEQIRESPRTYYYDALIEAYTKLNQIEQVHFYQNEMSYLFPEVTTINDERQSP